MALFCILTWLRIYFVFLFVHTTSSIYEGLAFYTLESHSVENPPPLPWSKHSSHMIKSWHVLCPPEVESVTIFTPNDPPPHQRPLWTTINTAPSLPLATLPCTGQPPKHCHGHSAELAGSWWGCMLVVKENVKLSNSHFGSFVYTVQISWALNVKSWEVEYEFQIWGS